MNAPEAVDQLVTNNVRLAHFFAAKWAFRLGENESLSMALEGLHKAAQDYDEAKGISFGNWASKQIQWTFGRYYHHAKRQKRGGGVAHVSFDAPLGDDSSATVGDMVMDENAETAAEETDFNDQQEHLRKMLAKLPDREALILTSRFGLDGGEKSTLEEIGIRLGLTRERVRQLEEIALEKLAKLTGVRRVKKRTRISAVEPRSNKPAPLADPFFQANPSPAPRSALKRRKYAATYRKANREKIRDYFRMWRERNQSSLRAYHQANIERTRKYRLAYYYRHHDRICRERRERYQTDEAYAEQRRQKSREWRLNNPEREKEAKTVYRSKHREKLRCHALKYARDLTAHYVRQQLAKKTGRVRESFTFEEVEACRRHLMERRSQLAARPRCPKCGKPSRKDGFYPSSRRQRYSCRTCGSILPRETFISGTSAA